MAKIDNYFDYAAATPVLPAVVSAMQPYLTDKFYNPSALYLDAIENRKILEASRHTISQGIGARPSEVIFTAGGTEANNLAIRGVLDNYPGGQVIVGATEHESVLEPAKLYDYKIATVDKKGIIAVDALAKLVSDKTVLISAMYANNEIGTIGPIKDVSAMVRDINRNRRKRGKSLPLYLHTDACQAANYLDMQVAKIGVDLMTINAGKIYGPKQCGALYINSQVRLKPIILGGGQEHGLRSGTQNLVAIAGFAAAWTAVRQDYRQEALRLAELRDEFISSITSKIPSAIINGSTGGKRLPNNINVTFPGKDNERLVMALDELGFKVAIGSACSAANDEPSHVLSAIGLPDKSINSSIRISLGRYTTQKSVAALAKSLTKIVALQ